MQMKLIITDEMKDGSGFIAISSRGEEVPIGWLKQSSSEEHGHSHGDFVQAPELKVADWLNQRLIDALDLTPLTIYLDGVSAALMALLADNGRQHVMVEWASHDGRGTVTLHDFEGECPFGLESFTEADNGQVVSVCKNCRTDDDYYIVPVSFNKGASMEDVVEAFIKEYPQAPLIVMNYLLNK